MGDTNGVQFEFIDSAEFHSMYPYHVIVAGRAVLKSRDLHKAKVVAACVRGQLWRTPVHPSYLPFMLCDFATEEWRAKVG